MNLRLLITKDCDRSCKGCCNRDWDLDNIPVNNYTFTGYDQVLITGGEPMLYPTKVKALCIYIRINNPLAKIIMYTAKTNNIVSFIETLKLLDGVTLTLHTQEDVKTFKALNKQLTLDPKKSYRLNIFSGIKIGSLDTQGWQVKEGLEWLKNCPLPENEVFMQLGNLWNKPITKKEKIK